MAPPRADTFYIDLYRENLKKKLLIWNQKARAFDIWYIAAKIVQIIALGQKWPGATGQTCFTKTYKRKYWKNLLWKLKA